MEDFSDAELEQQMLDRETGAGLLSRVESFLRRFVAYPSDHASVAHTLWIGHTHAIEAFDSTPRLNFNSAERGSGKTRALELTECLVPNPVHAVNTTSSYLFRRVGNEESGLPTVLYDEVDNLFCSNGDNAGEVRALINAGHRRGVYVGRCVMNGKKVETEEIPAFCPVALAGIGNLPDTIASRSILIGMRRRAPDEPVEPFRHRIHAGQAEPIKRALSEWCRDICEELEGFEPDMPQGVQDRDADMWESLLAIADAAGGDWPERARAAAVSLVAGAAESTQTTGVQLLSDLRDVFEGADKLATEVILKRLHDLPESAWADVRGKPLNNRGLATRLRKYGVKPKVLRIGDMTPRGYDAADLHDAWKRYLPRLPESAQQAQQTQHATQTATMDMAENCEKQAECCVVADVASPGGMGASVADTAQQDFTEERAAILQFDAGLTRAEAEAQARREA